MREKRFRLMAYQQPVPGSQRTGDGTYKFVGGVRYAETAERALSDYGPAEGRWIVLSEADGTYEEFTVKKRTETDILPAHPTAVAA